jgi:hypothetical protein
MRKKTEEKKERRKEVKHKVRKDFFLAMAPIFWLNVKLFPFPGGYQENH